MVVRPSIISSDKLRLAIVMAKQISMIRILRDADRTPVAPSIGAIFPSISSFRCIMQIFIHSLNSLGAMTLFGFTKLQGRKIIRAYAISTISNGERAPC